MESRKLPVSKRVQLLVEALDGAETNNEALSACANGQEMLEILISVSNKLSLGLTKQDLEQTPPIRDWIWWKNKQALVTLGKGTLRHQQDSASKTRWDSWTLDFFNLFRKK